MPKFHVVTRDEAQRLLLEKTVRSGTAFPRTVTRARVLLKANTGEFGPGWIDTEIADALDLGLSTVARTGKRAVLEGIEAAIVDRPRPRRTASSTVRPEKYRRVPWSSSDWNLPLDRGCAQLGRGHGTDELNGHDRTAGSDASPGLNSSLSSQVRE
jgi:hypothetical protein